MKPFPGGWFRYHIVATSRADHQILETMTGTPLQLVLRQLRIFRLFNVLSRCFLQTFNWRNHFTTIVMLETHAAKLLVYSDTLAKHGIKIRSAARAWRLDVWMCPAAARPRKVVRAEALHRRGPSWQCCLVSRQRNGCKQHLRKLHQRTPPRRRGSVVEKKHLALSGEMGQRTGCVTSRPGGRMGSQRAPGTGPPRCGAGTPTYAGPRYEPPPSRPGMPRPPGPVPGARKPGGTTSCAPTPYTGGPGRRIARSSKSTAKRLHLHTTFTPRTVG